MSNEYARADDDDGQGLDEECEGGACGTREMANGSDDEEFTYSYGDVLSAAAAVAGPGAIAAVAAAATAAANGLLPDGLQLEQANKPVEEVKLEPNEAIVISKPPPSVILLANAALNNNNKEMELAPIVSTPKAVVFDVLKLNIHRLPGETMGMSLRSGNEGSRGSGGSGRVMVSSVTENGAAERASDSNGNRCPVKVRDEIIEINGVLLSVS